MCWASLQKTLNRPWFKVWLLTKFTALTTIDNTSLKFSGRVCLKMLVLRIPCSGVWYPQGVRVPPVKNHWLKWCECVLNENFSALLHALRILNRQHFFMNDHLRFTGTLKGLSYRLKRCECVLNVLALSF